MKQRKTLIQILKSNEFAIIIAILSVLVQSFHSFTVFYNVSSLKGTFWGIAQAVLFAVIIDMAILFYTVRRNIKVTWMAGFIMVLINCYYYYSHLGIGVELILGGLLSLVIPVSVYYYSEEIHEEEAVTEIDWETHADQEDRHKAEVAKIMNERAQVNFELIERQQEFRKLRQEYEELRGVLALKERIIGELHGSLRVDKSQGNVERIPDGQHAIPKNDIDETEKKGFASLKSEAQNFPQDKSLLNVEPEEKVKPVTRTDRPERL